MKRKGVPARNSAGTSPCLRKMQTEFYRIAGLTFAVSADFEWLDRGLSQAFLLPGDAGETAEPIRLICRSVDRISAEESMPQICRDETLTLRKSGETLLKELRLYGSEEIYLSVRSREGSGEQQLFFSRAYREPAFRMRSLWDGVFLNHLLATRGKTVLHAAYIEVGGRAILFTAPSGTGKSTQAELWERLCGAETVNSDRAVLGWAADGTLTASGIPQAGTGNVCRDRTLPVAAIVRVKQSGVNRAVRLHGAEAVAALCENAVYDRYRTNDEEVHLGTFIGLTDRVPVYRLECLPGEEAVGVMKAALRSDGVRM